jgi:hypothetical protein
MIWPEDSLGLVLAWTRTRGLLMALQLIFGMTYTNLDDYLLSTKRIILMVLTVFITAYSLLFSSSPGFGCS